MKKPTKSNYWEKLKDPRWQRKRLEALNLSNFHCSSCGSDEKTLNVHHLYYKKGAEPWEYDVHTELQVLCEDCHKSEHKQEESFNESLQKFKRDSPMLGLNLDFIKGVLDGLMLGATPYDEYLHVISAEHASGIALAHGIYREDGENLIIELARSNNGILNNHQFTWAAFPESRKDQIREAINVGRIKISTYIKYGDFDYWPEDFKKEISLLQK